MANTLEATAAAMVKVAKNRDMVLAKTGVRRKPSRSGQVADQQLEGSRAWQRVASYMRGQEIASMLERVGRIDRYSTMTRLQVKVGKRIASEH